MNLKSTLENVNTIVRKPYIQIGILVFLISLLSFGIGYVVGHDFNQAPIIINKAEPPQ